MIFNIFQKYKWRMIAATLFSALSSIISIFLLALINDNIKIDSLEDINQAIPMFFAFIIALFVISFVSQMFLTKLGTHFVYDLRRALLQQTINADYQNLERIGGHRVLATITTDVSSISMSLAILPVFAVNLATITFCLIYLMMQSVTLFSFWLVGLLVGLSVSILIMRRGRYYFAEFREKQDNLFNVFKTLVDGSKELNINQNRRDFFYQDLALPSLVDIKDTEIKAKGYWVLSESLVRSLLFLTLGVVLFVSHSILSIESVVLTSFILFTTYLVGPIAFVQNAVQTLVKGKISYDKIKKLQLFNEQASYSNYDLNKEGDWSEISFKDLKYTYQNEAEFKFAIGPINLSIERGTTVFICGGNGSGKSTFAKILVGLYRAQEGHIHFAGKEITVKNQQWYRNHFSTVFSDFFLFEHILDSKGDLVDTEDMKPHLEKLMLTGKIDIVDGKISTTKLSQGQRKRLAMLLAYAEDSPIYLFDEWAADQDPMFREYFYTELLPGLKRKGKTLIVITHDDKYFSLADRLIEFDNGQAIELVVSKNKYSVSV